MLNAVDASWDASMRTIQIRDPVSSITFSPKDDSIAVSEVGFVEIFETLTGHRRATLTRPEFAGIFLSLTFSPDDTLLATGHRGGIISVWDLQTGGLVWSLKEHTEAVESVAFSPCGTMIASGSNDNTVRIWNVLSRNCRCVLEGHSDTAWSVCWSATRDEVISGSMDKTARVWDINRMRCLKTLSGYLSGIYSVACSPDSSVIASGSEDGVKIFNVQTGDGFQTILTDSSVESIRFLDQDTVMYATNQPTFVIHDLTGKTNTPTPKSKNWLKRCFRKAQIELLQSRRHHNEIDLAKDAKALTFKYRGDITAISSDGTRIASRTDINTVTIWQTDGPSPTNNKTGHDSHVSGVAISGDGQLVASGSYDYTAKLWDPATGRCLHTFSHPGFVRLVKLSPDSTLLASTTSDHIRIWDTRSHNLISTINIAGRDPLLRFSLNGNRLVSLTGDLKLWDVATGTCLASLDVGRSFRKVVFGVDGTSVILESRYSVVRYGISPTHSCSSNHDKDDHPSLPLKFVPLRDTRPSVSSHFYCYRQGSEWIIDEQERRVLWVPPDLRYKSDSCGKKVALGSRSGRVVMVDI